MSGKKGEMGVYWNDHALSAVESDGKSKQGSMMPRTNLKPGLGGATGRAPHCRLGKTREEKTTVREDGSQFLLNEPKDSIFPILHRHKILSAAHWSLVQNAGVTPASRPPH